MQQLQHNAALGEVSEGGAMSDVEHALVFGMPCCKKWMFYREDQKPLYYQDDNGPCYVYAYADQMVADAWLALEDKDRARFAPAFASFDPTDLAAIAHVKRLYYKYRELLLVKKRVLPLRQPLMLICGPSKQLVECIEFYVRLA